MCSSTALNSFLTTLDACKVWELLQNGAVYKLFAKVTTYMCCIWIVGYNDFAFLWKLSIYPPGNGRKNELLSPYEKDFFSLFKAVLCIDDFKAVDRIQLVIETEKNHIFASLFIL
jgi:hypothetical protein